MSEFFEPPPPPEEFRDDRPAGSDPPRGSPREVVGIELLLAQSEKAATHIADLTAYPTGFEFEVKAIAASEEHEFARDVFGRHWPTVGEKRDELPPQLLRVGVQFADGRKATNITGHDGPPLGPVMWPLAGAAGGGSFHQAYWVWPLPPPGPLTFVCEWPAARIPLTRREIDAQLILDAADRAGAVAAEDARLPATRVRDGHEWRIGTDAEVAWINDGTSQGTAITAAIPPIFAAYCTLELPQNGDAELTRHEQAVIALLGEHTEQRPWWLGYLDTGASDIVFPDVPRPTVYYGYRYVLVEAGPQQAATWRHTRFNWALPDLMFPADRSWLVSTMWDHDWTCIGGPEDLVASFLGHTELGPRARRVALGQDATPPGHGAQ